MKQLYNPMDVAVTLKVKDSPELIQVQPKATIKLGSIEIDENHLKAYPSVHVFDDTPSKAEPVSQVPASVQKQSQDIPATTDTKKG